MPAMKSLDHLKPSDFGKREGMLGCSVSAYENLDASLRGKFVIVGIPDERGVAANYGFPGASQGPTAFREAFYRLYDTRLRMGAYQGTLLSEHVVDLGNVPLSERIEDTHESLADTVRVALEHGAELVVVIGGGHDFAFGSYAGHVLARKSAGQKHVPLINLDAHLDLRPTEGGHINSGTAFRRIVEQLPAPVAHGRALLELGIQRERNPESLFAHASAHGIGIVEYVPFLHVWRHLASGREVSPKEHVLDHLDLMSSLGWERSNHSLHLSLCMDVFRSDIAPGTSASTPFGVTPEEVGLLLSYLGRTSPTRVLDIAELSPPRDINGQTSRLAAALVLRFILMRLEHGAPSN